MEEFAPGKFICRDEDYRVMVHDLCCNIGYVFRPELLYLNAIITKSPSLSIYIPAVLFCYGHMPARLIITFDTIYLETTKINNEESIDVFHTIAMVAAHANDLRILTTLLQKGISTNIYYNSIPLLAIAIIYRKRITESAELLINYGANVLDAICWIAGNYGSKTLENCEKLKKYLNLRGLCIFEIIKNRCLYRSQINTLPRHNLTECVYKVYNINN